MTEQPYALEDGGCWHAVTAHDDAGRWTAACGTAGQPYRGQPSSITSLASPPSPLCCPHPALSKAQRDQAQYADGLAAGRTRAEAFAGVDLHSEPAPAGSSLNYRTGWRLGFAAVRRERHLARTGQAPA